MEEQRTGKQRQDAGKQRREAGEQGQDAGEKGPDAGEKGSDDPRHGSAGGADAEVLARSFEVHRPQLRAVAYRVLGSAAEAEDAVQEAWFRLSRTDAGEVENLGGWLTTVVGRVCLDMLRSRRSRAEEPLDSGPPVAVADEVTGPEQDALLADSVGVALLVVLDALTPAERLAFVLHDLFAVPFEEVAGILGRSPAAARQLASRARRRVQGAPVPGADLARQRKVVDAFLAAARDGDFDGLMAVLDPDVVARSAAGVATGAAQVVVGATRFPHLARLTRVALVDGALGLVMMTEGGRPERVLTFTFVRDRIAAIDIIVAPDDRLSRLTITPAGGSAGGRQTYAGAGRQAGGGTDVRSPISEELRTYLSRNAATTSVNASGAAWWIRCPTGTVTM